MVASVRSALAYAFIGFFTLIVGPFALLATYATGSVRHIMILGIFAERVARRIVGLRYRVDGLDRVREDRPAVYIINHRSDVDVLVFEVLYARCRRLRGLYKAELGRLPILGRVMRSAGFVPVERHNSVRAKAAVEFAAAKLREGDSIVLAPEGTRSPTDELLPFKKGGFVMAIRAQVPVVPVALIGTHLAMPKGSPIIRPARVLVRIGRPIDTRGLTFEDRDVLVARAREAMEQLLKA